MGVKTTLKKFLDVSGISGTEDNVLNLMKKELKGNVDEIHEDKVGNLITKKGKGKIKVLLTAHMDEIGFMVKSITEKGYLKINPVGGWDPKILPSQKVKIYTEKGVKQGVIGSKAIHMQEKEEVEKVKKLKQLSIDVGAKDKKDAEKKGFNIGDYVEVGGELTELENGRVSGRCLDNRISCAVLTEVMKKAKTTGITIYGVGSVQEEVGLKGARAAMFGVNPDIIISLDVAMSSGPFVSTDEVPNELGKGAVIGIQDSAFVVHKKVRKLLVESAKKKKIPYQLGVSGGGTTEATAAILTREGKPGGLVGVPVRYMHTTVETAEIKDMENAVKLVVESMNNVKKYF